MALRGSSRLLGNSLLRVLCCVLCLESHAKENGDREERHREQATVIEFNISSAAVLYSTRVQINILV